MTKHNDVMNKCSVDLFSQLPRVDESFLFKFTIAIFRYLHGGQIVTKRLQTESAAFVIIIVLLPNFNHVWSNCW